MRIAVIHSFYTERQPSGENAVVMDQVQQLASAGHTVELISRRTDDYSASGAYPVRAAATTLSGLGPNPAAELRRFAPDVVHLHNTFPNWGVRWLKEWGTRTVATMHNYRPMCSNGLQFRDGRPCTDCLSTPVIPALRHRCYRGSFTATLPLAVASSPRGSLRSVPERSARIVALNDFAQAMYERVLKRSVDLVPNFVDGGSVVGGVPERWVYVGRLSSEKGVSEMLRRWPRSESLDIIGDGPLMEAVRVASMSNPAIRALGLLPRAEVLSRLSQYRGLILPSMCQESLPTVVLEALGHGLPLVLSRHIQAAESLARDGAAEIFDPDGVGPTLEGLLARVTSNRDSYQSKALNVHRRRYSPAAWQAAMDDIYRGVIEAARR